MIRMNFREACLLDASGELGKTARRELLEYIRDNPAANGEYHEIRQTLESLEHVPPTEFSAKQRIEIPAQIKNTIRRALRQQQHEKQAATRQKLIRRALLGVGSLAALLFLTMGVRLPQAAAIRHDREQLASVNAAIDHLLSYGDQPVNSYNKAVTDVEASIRQLQVESPTLAQVQDHSMSKLLLDVAGDSPGRLG